MESFAYYHKQHWGLLGIDALTDKGETISADSYPDQSKSSQDTKKDSEIVEVLYHQITEINLDEATSNKQKQEYYDQLFNYALNGHRDAQKYIIHFDRFIRDVEPRRPQYQSDGETLLFKALNHFLVYN